MTIFEILILAVGLSMDAMAVAICKGLSVCKLKKRHAIITGLYFGGFQAAMPLIGYFLGKQFQSYITSFDHWIAFVLLALIGANMIKESFEEAECVNASFSPRAMLPMAVATSIDALAAGVALACVPAIQGGVWIAVGSIGLVTFSLSVGGVWIGHIFGARFKSRAERVGGIVLILMGIKILLEHLGVLDWFFGLFA